MLVADAFVVPDVGVVVTGVPVAGDIREGDRLWLDQGAVRCQVTVRGVRHFCPSFIDPTVAPSGVNTSLILDGVPENAKLNNFWLLSA